MVKVWVNFEVVGVNNSFLFGLVSVGWILIGFSFVGGKVVVKIRYYGKFIVIGYFLGSNFNVVGGVFLCFSVMEVEGEESEDEVII